MKKEHEDLLCEIINKNKPTSNRQFWRTEIISIVEQFLKETGTNVKNLAQPDVSWRSELLAAFFDYIKGEVPSFRLKDINTERAVNDFLKSRQ